MFTDVIFLSRLQFAVSTAFHFIFVPLSIGLALLVVLMETQYVRTRDREWKRQAWFWGRILAMNFILGVVTGITLEFQFGTNWSAYSKYVGDVFGPLLAIEVTTAFFLESTFLAVWVFGWRKLSARAHLVSIWAVLFGSLISAYWIIAANSWMQHPVGYAIRNGRAEITDFFAVVTQWAAVIAFAHTVTACLVLGGFFVLGVSALNLLRGREQQFFIRAIGVAAPIALIFSVLLIVEGHLSGEEVANMQPAKLAAMESHWQTGSHVPLSVLAWPDEENEGNIFEAIEIPGGLSFLSYSDFDAEVKGLKDFPPEDRPPVLISFLAFRLMVGIGTALPLIAGLAWLMRRRIAEPKLRPLRLLLAVSLPLPGLAILAGWALTEVGRQPWIVYGVMRTKDAVSPIAASQAAGSLVLLFLLFSVILIVGAFLIGRFALQGPPDADGPAFLQEGGRS